MLGMNAIAVYVLSELLTKLLWLANVNGVSTNEFIKHLFVPFISPQNISLLFAFTQLFIVLIVASLLYRRK